MACPVSRMMLVSRMTWLHDLARNLGLEEDEYVEIVDDIDTVHVIS